MGKAIGSSHHGGINYRGYNVCFRSRFASSDRRLSIEFIVDEVELDLVEGFGFSEFAVGEAIVELAHEQCSAGVIHGPQGSENGFGSTTEEVAADA